jgi:TonB family protein
MMKRSFLFLIAALFGAAPAAAQSSGGVTWPTAANDHTATQGMYPPIARALDEEGKTLISFTVNEDGSVGNVTVAHSSGYARLDAASVAMARDHWLYHPAMKDGKPIPVTHMANVVWKLTLVPDAAIVPAIVMKPEDFPAGAWDRREETVDRFKLTVDSKGSVVDCDLLSSSDFSDLDDAAQEFVSKRWAIVPPAIAGEPAPGEIFINLVWTTLPDELPK